MSEPELRDIGDYDTLKGEKKKIVWIVIAVGLLIGVAFFIANKVYDASDESIKVNDSISIVPGSKSIPIR